MGVDCRGEVLDQERGFYGRRWLGDELKSSERPTALVTCVS